MLTTSVVRATCAATKRHVLALTELWSATTYKNRPWLRAKLQVEMYALSPFHELRAWTGIRNRDTRLIERQKKARLPGAGFYGVFPMNMHAKCATAHLRSKPARLSPDRATTTLHPPTPPSSPSTPSRHHFMRLTTLSPLAALNLLCRTVKVCTYEVEIAEPFRLPTTEPTRADAFGILSRAGTRSATRHRVAVPSSPAHSIR